MSSKWADVSEFQSRLDDSYPYRWVYFRSNDGTRVDAHFTANYAWALSALSRGRIDGFGVYAVYEPDGGAWARTHMNLVGAQPPARMVSMADVENWNGRITGDHSPDINAGLAAWAAWHGDSRRAVGYGNRSDLNNLWPNKGHTAVILANYSNPAATYPNMFALQYTDAEYCPPFGKCDMNSSGMDIPGLLAFHGMQNNPPLPTHIGENEMYAVNVTPADATRPPVAVMSGAKPVPLSPEEWQNFIGGPTYTVNARQYDLALSIASQFVPVPALAPTTFSDAQIAALSADIVAALPPAPGVPTAAEVASAVLAAINAAPLTLSGTVS